MLQRLEIEPPIAESSRGVLRESSAACAARALPGGAAAVSAAGGRWFVAGATLGSSSVLRRGRVLKPSAMVFYIR